MYFLVRTVTGRTSGKARPGQAAATLDNEYQGDALTLGGDDEAMVPLAISGSLLIEASGNGAGKISARDSSLQMNGRTVRRARVKVGDELAVPGYALAVIAPPAGFDFALQLAPTGAALPPYSANMSVAGLAWSMRRASWIGAALVLLLGLALPLAGIFDDALWSTGPLAPAHRTAGLGQQCEACHAEPFVRVEDGACLACHRSTTEHIDLAGQTAAAYPADHFLGQRCGGCHREHNEPPHLVRRDRGQCVDCHGNVAAWQDEVQAVSGFSAAGHPQFRLALLVPQGPGGVHGWAQERVRKPPGELQERSNLKFTHRDHLDPAKVREPGTDAPLVCATCHSLQDNGEHFEAVTMDKDCRRCHSLNFDMFEPELQLPHGDLRAAVVAMEAHFIREFTDPVLRRQRALKKPRRVPGKREAAASCLGTGLDCGRAEALKEAQFQFAETGCVSCHQVTDTGLADISDRWYVQPVRITGDWYPHARFDHRGHFNLALADPDAAAGAECASCHRAAESNAATDILVPARATCLECHNEDKGDTTVACVGCHRFHTRGGSVAARVRGDVSPGEGLQP